MAAQQSAAPAKADEEKQQTSSKPGSIKGRVIGEDGQPMANIPVAAISIGRSAARRAGGQSPQTNTDDDGAFEFEGLAPASYAISASAPGYITPPPEGENSAGVYRVGEFANITLVKGGVITGKVTNSAGEPLTGVSVYAVRVGGVDGEADNQPVFQGFGRNWRTDDRGVYRIYGLVPGAYIIQAGGGSGFGPNLLSPFGGDAPTYYPSSPREAAAHVLVRAGEEVAGIDVRYRGDKGRVISGRVTAKTGGDGARSGPIQITLSIAGSDAVVATALQMGRGPMNRGASGGFALYGVPDGEYEIIARLNGFGAESDAVSAPRRVSAHGANVSGIELVLTPLASLSGRVVVENKAASCQQSRASSVEEILLVAERDDAQAREATLAGRLAPTRPAAPNAAGEFTLRNLEAGRHRVTARLPDENWYVRAISIEGKPSAPTARRTPAPAPANIARIGVTSKPGEKLSGVTVRIAEGAAGLKGRVDRGGKASGKIRAHLIPAEKEAADDVLRYAQVNADGDGAFRFKNLAPGRYYLLAKQIKDGDAHARQEAWDTVRRAALRKEAEAAGAAIELQSCQRVNDYRINY
ncbi:MAG: carboxypeptidase regulatory-like domain-containing protein [Blastocatellales bacterium]